MIQHEHSLLQRIKDGLEMVKRPLAYLLAVLAVLLETLPDILPDYLQELAVPMVLILLVMLLIRILFDIHEEVVTDKAELNTIDSSDLYQNVFDIVTEERSKVTIQYIGIAGRSGWTDVIERLLRSDLPGSLTENRVAFHIDIALIDPELVAGNGPAHDPSLFARFGHVGPNTQAIQNRIKGIERDYKPRSTIRLAHYKHMPNMVGILVNGNYLFLTHSYCDKENEHSPWRLHSGKTNYYVYNKNDRYGGQEMITRFVGWSNYIHATYAKTRDADTPEDRTPSETVAQAAS